MSDTAWSGLKFDRDGLVPAIIQDADTDTVLMLGFMNAEALRLTRETGRVHFWSRSRAKLWRKGETSGHEQIVHEIFVNCEENTLLIKVEQLGAVCHTGYPTCFFRRLEADDSLTVVGERRFDPAAVYGGQPSLADRTKEWLGAFEFLRDRDLTEVSSTSRRLRDRINVDNRIADELRELAGVIDGSHLHRGQPEDAMLEGSQVLYWIAVAAVQNGHGWTDLRPDIALRTADDQISAGVIAWLLQADSVHWQRTNDNDRVARFRATMELVAQAVAVAGVKPDDLIAADLADLRSKPYLNEYFET
jgi:phosphoribosyl-AMP cyclohydrolase